MERSLQASPSFSPEDSSKWKDHGKRPQAFRLRTPQKKNGDAKRPQAFRLIQPHRRKVMPSVPRLFEKSCQASPSSSPEDSSRKKGHDKRPQAFRRRTPKHFPWEFLETERSWPASPSISPEDSNRPQALQSVLGGILGRSFFFNYRFQASEKRVPYNGTRLRAAGRDSSKNRIPRRPNGCHYTAPAFYKTYFFYGPPN